MDNYDRLNEFLDYLVAIGKFDDKPKDTTNRIPDPMNNGSIERVKEEALADIEREQWREYEQEQRMKERNG